MLVFNLTRGPVKYRRVQLPPNGGSFNFKDMTYVPTRDRKLVMAKVLAFGALPQWWIDKRNAELLGAQVNAEKMAAKAPEKVSEKASTPVEKFSTEDRVDVKDEMKVKSSKKG
jgi:hypothetical protein